MKKSNYFTMLWSEMFGNHDSIFSRYQLKIINQPTPKEHIELKVDKDGFKYKSVKASYVKRLVMLVVGGNFDFEIKSREFIASTRETLVEGRLTIYTFEGRAIVREQFGRHYLNSKTEVNGNKTISRASDIGNGYKAAASDAFKKCASEFGFCWDIYGQERAIEKVEEQPEPSNKEAKKLVRLNHFLSDAKTPEQIQEVYNTYLKTANETKPSENLLVMHLERLGITKI